MSEFSQKLKDAIKKSNMTLTYLSKLSGLSISHISKMRQGTRLPGEEDKVYTLIRGLRCSEALQKELIEAYQIERMGREFYKCFSEIKYLIEHAKNEKNPDISSQIDYELPEVSVIHGMIDVNYMIHAVLQREKKEGNHVQIIAQPQYEYLMKMLSVLFRNTEIRCEHIICFEYSQINKNEVYNIHIFAQMMPLLFADFHYIPFYHYEDVESYFQEINMIPYWIITSSYAIGIFYDREDAFILSQKEQVNLMRQWFERIKEHCNPFVSGTYSLLEYSEYAFQKEKKMKLNEEIYMLQRFPFFLLLMMSADTVQKNWPAWSPLAQALLSSLQKRRPYLEQKKIVIYFTMKGLREFTNKGIAEEIPREERVTMVITLLDRLKDEKIKYYLIDEQKLHIPDNFFITSYSQAESEVIYFNSGKEYCSITEQSICTQLYQFCQYLKNSDIILNKEKAAEVMEEERKYLKEIRDKKQILK